MMLRLSAAGLLMGMAALAGTASSTTPTFDKDVLPILQKHCQTCHRPGEVAPMSLITYKDARPWAKSIKQAVATKKMPPWFADYGHFANDRTLKEADVKTLEAWADSGAPEGDAKDAPPPLTFTNGWNIKPDMIVEMPKPFRVAATGTINYQYILVKVNFPEDEWVIAAEMRPGNPKVVHHGRVIVRPPGSHWMATAIPGEPYEDNLSRGGKAPGRHGSIGQVQSRTGRAELRCRGFGQVHPERLGPGFQHALHFGGYGAGRPVRSRSGVREDIRPRIATGCRLERRQPSIW